MGASGSVNKGNPFYEDVPGRRTPRTTRSTGRMSEDHEFDDAEKSGSWGKGLEPKSRKSSAKSTNEEIQELVRMRISANVLLGKSLLTPCPPISSPGPGGSPRGSPRTNEFKSTLFDHVALPSPLPQTLCETDVAEFRDLAIWEEHLRQTKPWLDGQKISSTASLITGIQSPNTVETRKLAFYKHTGNCETSPSTNSEMLERVARVDPSRSSSTKRIPARRGNTFVSLPAARKNSVDKGTRSVHNPHIKQVIDGLGVLLSYLIEEPPDVYIKNQSWDIFSVPGDKSKVRRPVTDKERAAAAGDIVIKPGVVSDFLESLYKICKWTSECHIIAFILMIRCVSMSQGKVYLHRYNWECMLLVSLMVSQKCWDDVSLNNVDFPQVWKMVSPKGGEIDLKDVNFMEREFLSILGYKVSVGMRLYTSCYYEVMALSLLNDPNSKEKLAHYQKKNVRERYAVNQYHLIGNNTKYQPDDEDNEREEYADDVKLLDDSKNQDVLSKCAMKAHRKYERRNTVDVLCKTPPKGAKRSISML